MLLPHSKEARQNRPKAGLRYNKLIICKKVIGVDELRG